MWGANPIGYSPVSSVTADDSVTNGRIVREGGAVTDALRPDGPRGGAGAGP